MDLYRSPVKNLPKLVKTNTHHAHTRNSPFSVTVSTLLPFGATSCTTLDPLVRPMLQRLYVPLNSEGTIRIRQMLFRANPRILTTHVPAQGDPGSRLEKGASHDSTVAAVVACYIYLFALSEHNGPLLAYLLRTNSLEFGPTD